jgi:ABC-type uncharacterized transport system involved in gliding motility auxiliary subunit
LYTGLPHHISELDEITAMGNTTEKLLKSLDRPLYVTFATSRSDRYLPDCQAALIHGMLDEMVERVYKRVKVIRRDCPKYTINFDSDSESEEESSGQEMMSANETDSGSSFENESMESY